MSQFIAFAKKLSVEAIVAKLTCLQLFLFGEISHQSLPELCAVQITNVQYMYLELFFFLVCISPEAGYKVLFHVHKSHLFSCQLLLHTLYLLHSDQLMYYHNIMLVHMYFVP